MNLPSRRYVPLFMIGLMVLTGLFAGVMAYAQSTKTALQTQIASCFPTQTVGAITPPITVTCMNAIIASMQQYAGVNAQTTTSYTVLQSDYGQLVTFNNTAAISATLPQPISSAFYPFNVFLKNVGAGAVNLLPVGSTVNSATTLQLITGQSVWLVSDNANWQAWNAGTTGPLVSVTSSDGSLNISTNGGAITESINTSHVNTWLNSQIFSTSSLGLGMPSGGVITLLAQPTTGSATVTVPFANDTLVVAASGQVLSNKTLTAPVMTGVSNFTGQIWPDFGTPTIASGACGASTNGTLATSSTNQAGKIIIGGGATGGCNINFSTTLTQTPVSCVVTPALALAATNQLSSVFVSSITNSAWVLTGNILASTNWYYHCF